MYFLQLSSLGKDSEVGSDVEDGRVKQDTNTTNKSTTNLQVNFRSLTLN